MTIIGRNSQLGRSVQAGRPSSGVSPTAPLTIVTSSAAIFFLSGDLGVTVATGVSQWNDQSGNGRDATQATSGSQPAYNATGLNGRGTVTYDGVDDFSTIAWIPPAPGTTPSWYWLVFRSPTTASGGQTIFASNNTNRHRFQWSTATGMNSNCGSSTGTLTRAANTWYRAEVFFNNSTTDYKHVGNQNQTGISGGNNAGVTAFYLGAVNATPVLLSNVEIAAIGAWPAEPTSGEKSALDAWVTAYYGATVEV